MDTTIPTNRDWTRFGWDATRSNTSLAPSDIAAANIATLGRQQVQIDGLVDASAFYSTKCRKSIPHQQARCGFVRQVRLFSFAKGERDGLLTRHVYAELADDPSGCDKFDGQSPSRKAS